MIENSGDYRSLSCDECGETSNKEFHRDDFFDGIDAATKEGWWIKKVDGWGWMHNCPACARATRMKAQVELLREDLKPVREKRDLL